MQSVYASSPKASSLLFHLRLTLRDHPAISIQPQVMTDRSSELASTGSALQVLSIRQLRVLSKLTGSKTASSKLNVGPVKRWGNGEVRDKRATLTSDFENQGWVDLTCEVEEEERERTVRLRSDDIQVSSIGPYGMRIAPLVDGTMDFNQGGPPCYGIDFDASTDDFTDQTSDEYPLQ
jgi:DNA-binding transcriptional regulator YiaG